MSGEFLYQEEGGGSYTSIKAARKEHECSGCRNTIEVGSPYEKYEYFGFWHSTFKSKKKSRTWKLCAECDSVARHFWDHYETVGLGDIQDAAIEAGRYNKKKLALERQKKAGE
jgi:hypothetical protein